MSDVDAIDLGSADRDPLEELAEDFLRRRRDGEAVSISEVAEHHPELAERIRDLFPTLLLMEELKPASATAHPGALVPPHFGEGVNRLGDFKILREIGRGGMGVVYEAEQESLGRRVALKVLPANCLASPTRLRRFQREAQAAARLHHTNIVPIFGVGQQDGLHYYVMQYIPGQGLDQVLSALSYRVSGSTTSFHGEEGQPPESHVAQGTFSAARAAQILFSGAVPSEGMAGVDSDVPRQIARSSSGSSAPAHGYWRRVARIGVQVADALEYAHRQGILHRDIKPANLLLDNVGTVWIADFGLAKLAGHEDLTHSGDMVGTLRYMAPEQFQGKADTRSDVYSLGLTLYELLALRPAFDETDRRRLIRQVTQGEPPRPRKINAAIPRDLETIVVKSIAWDPGHRYSTAGELAADLRCFLEDRPIRARRVAVAGRVWRWCRRNRAVAALAGTALALLVGIALVASIGYLRTNEALQRVSVEREQAETARRQAEDERTRTKAERERAEANLHLATRAFEDIFGKVAADPVVANAQDDSEDDVPEPAWETPVTDKDATVLESMLKFYDQFAQQNQADVKLQKETARAYRRVGEIQQRLGQYDKAETAYRRALAMYQRVADAAGENADCLATMAAISNDLGVVCRNTGRFLDARQFHVQAQETLRKQSPQAAALAESRFELARTYGFLSVMTPGPRREGAPWHHGRHRRGEGGQSAAYRSPDRPATLPDVRRHNPEMLKRQAESAENNRKALEILEKLTKEAPDNPRYRLAMARSQRDRTMIAGFSGRAEEAGRAKQETIRILEELIAIAPNSPDYRYELGETYALPFPRPRDEKIADGTMEQLRRAIEIGTGLVARYPTVPEYKAALARWHGRWAELSRSGEPASEIETHLAEAARLEKSLVAEFPSVIAYRFFMARSLDQLSVIQAARHEPDLARTSLEEAIANSEKIQAASAHPPPARMLASQYVRLAEVLREMGEGGLADQADASARKIEDGETQRGASAEPGPK